MIKKWAVNSKIFYLIKSVLSRIFVPGFEKINLYEILVFFFKGVINYDITTQASSLAFKFFLAIFPGLIFLITLIPYVPIQNFQNQLLEILKDFLPGGAFEALEETLNDLIKNQNGSLLSFGFLFALFLATDGIHAMINAFNSSDHKEETRSMIKIRLISILLVFIITLLLIVSIGLIVFSGVIINFLKSNSIIYDELLVWALIIGKWIITLGMFFTSISFIFWLGPDRKHKFRFVSAGSTFTTFFSIFISLVFAYYVDNFGNYNKLYGSIGTVMVVMLWMYFNSIGLLLGYQLNASLKKLKSV
ncbi:MAG: YihY/virulence factor BrkB family protein [Bacteroidia bacterium]|jgi:membrane protein